MATSSCRTSGCGGCLVGLLVIALLGVFAGGSLWMIRNLGRMATSQTAEAVVVELIPDFDSDGVTYAPVVEYEVGGVTYRLQSQVSYGGLAVPEIGDRKQVLYNPDDPTDAVFRSFWTLWFLPILMIVIPAVILALIVYSVIRTARRRARESEMIVFAGSPGEFRRTGVETIDIEPVDERTEFLPPLGEGGEPIEAMFMGAEPSPMDADGNVRYRITARAEIDGEVRRFTGPWLDEDPTLALMQQGNRVTVIVDPTDPARYRLVLPF